MAKKTTKRELTAYLSDLNAQLEESPGNTLHSMVFFNQLLRDPEATKHLDDDLKIQAREIWTRLKESGLELNEPPILFESS